MNTSSAKCSLRAINRKERKGWRQQPTKLKLTIIAKEGFRHATKDRWQVAAAKKNKIIITTAMKTSLAGSGEPTTQESMTRVVRCDLQWLSTFRAKLYEPPDAGKKKKDFDPRASWNSIISQKHKIKNQVQRKVKAKKPKNWKKNNLNPEMGRIKSTHRAEEGELFLLGRGRESRRTRQKQRPSLKEVKYKQRKERISF